MADAIVSAESGGKCAQRGATGEWGCFQFMPRTWIEASHRFLGYVAEQTPATERYVALLKIQSYFEQGHDEDNIARIWNQGNAGPCVRGINSSGVAYDSCSYEQKVLAMLR